MFTQHPRTGDRSLVVIEASYGLGEAVVGGEVTPDLFEVNKITRQIHHSSLGTKTVEHRLAEDGRGVQTVPVEPQRQQAWSISEEEVTALLDMAGELEASLGRGLDVEWAIGTTRSSDNAEALFALQVRPITVDARRSPVTHRTLTPSTTFSAGSPGASPASQVMTSTGIFERCSTRWQTLPVKTPSRSVRPRVPRAMAEACQSFASPTISEAIRPEIDWRTAPEAFRPAAVNWSTTPATSPEASLVSSSLATGAVRPAQGISWTLSTRTSLLDSAGELDNARHHASSVL